MSYVEMEIANIWIESEQNGAIISGELEVNDNSDVIVTLKNKSRYIATFFTYQNIEHLRKKNQETGECLTGKYFWASDMILIDKINRESISKIIEELIKEGYFTQIFRRI